LTVEEFHFCEPKQGDILGEEDEDDERLITSLMNYLYSSYQHMDVIKEGLREDENPIFLKTDNLCVFTGFVGLG
jgi:hypothetical protein